MPTFTQALAELKAEGAAHASEAAVIAGLCDGPLQTVCGAVSPKLVFDGAMKKGLSVTEFSHLMATDPRAIADLMWL
ncbi:Uncharacterised protein (plasmid) [Tsukamurella tyrosinosolvens]|uniref:Uncharacterized protein n=1 Tax=Tsukamurella tyrosinosolvens TaxID=57704 RepID=A0A1H4V4C0_TSUTY|nr:hypothetical protein [Tsukamurella tyrosinosolvens]KXO91065.1 hypothetical protein AXK58_21785 [Tsukamurella tyrosinosolvens]SEC75371.1 hypothetical protein SAMN04489793_3124 [Tsukamurella tyrosinosolvens]VEH90716.1 Uncharacterised protein [Tsukamurella tyrosinosolvens]